VKVLLCPDSFKGALSAPEAARAMAGGWRRVFPEAQLLELPVADGGEGTLDVLLSATGGERFIETVTGPLGEPVEAGWGLLPDGVAVIELAQAAGLSLVPPEKRDPKRTTTYGVGELIKAALRRTDRLIVTLGGSATNDGGAGIIKALGESRRSDIDVRIAVDVDNPLTGPRGASAIFGPQKGATPFDVRVLDAALANFARERGLPEQPGDGAAGGAAYGLRWLFSDAKLIPGIELVLDAIDFERHLEGADLVLTGEGRLDSQTLGGKVIAGVARRGRAKGVPLVALVGSIGADVSGAALERVGIAATFSLAPGPCTLEESMASTADWLADGAERIARLYGLSQGQLAG
jgi:glycerate kinase